MKHNVFVYAFEQRHGICLLHITILCFMIFVVLLMEYALVFRLTLLPLLKCLFLSANVLLN